MKKRERERKERRERGVSLPRCAEIAQTLINTWIIYKYSHTLYIYVCTHTPPCSSVGHSRPVCWSIISGVVLQPSPDCRGTWSLVARLSYNAPLRMLWFYKTSNVAKKLIEMDYKAFPIARKYMINLSFWFVCLFNLCWFLFSCWHRCLLLLLD